MTRVKLGESSHAMKHRIERHGRTEVTLLNTSATFLKGRIQRPCYQSGGSMLDHPGSGNLIESIAVQPYDHSTASPPRAASEKLIRLATLLAITAITHVP